jgi:hypothetical protein
VDLLTNAVQSIQLGVEDYGCNSHPRLLSAVRNIHAGILLLYKEALRRKSPAGSNDALIKAKIVPSLDANGNVVFIGSGKKTVDTQQIRERFAGLKIATDWTRLDSITEARNALEHYYPQLTQQALHGLLTDAFLIIRSFIAGELNDDPRTLLGDQTWQAMLHVSEVHAEERRECQARLDKIKWVSDALKEGLPELTCDQCGSDLLRPVNIDSEVQLKCSSCGKTEIPDSYVPKAIASALDSAAYMAVKDGGTTPYVMCPECGNETYVIDEQRCALCEHEAEHTCIRCSNEIPPEELDSSPLCSWCAHMSSKDD